MKTTIKKTLALLLSAMLLLTTVPFAASAAEAAAQEQSVGSQSGTTGDCTWTLDGNGNLTISGNGAMDNYFYDNDITTAPWGAGINSVVIENGVTGIGEYAFLGCNSLTSVSIGNSVTSIGKFAFYDCIGLISLNIPESVTSISEGAFWFCVNLKFITIPDSATNIEDAVFFYTAWYDFQPDGVVYAGKVAYSYKGNMPDNTSVTFQDGTKSISDYAFYGLTGLTSVTIPDSVTRINEGAFAGCSGLTAINIPDSVTYIGDIAFEGCNDLTIFGMADSCAQQYADDNNIPFRAVDERTAGDADGDGSISVRDVTAIQRHLADLDTLTGTKLAAADTNGDGNVTIDDVTLLQMYIAEYDVELG